MRAWLIPCLIVVGCGDTTVRDMASVIDMTIAEDSASARDLAQPAVIADGGTFFCAVGGISTKCALGSEYCSVVDPKFPDSGTPSATCVPLPSNCVGKDFCDCVFPTIQCYGRGYCSNEYGGPNITCAP